MENYSLLKPDFFTYKDKWVYNWFSNMILCDIVIDNILYKSVENYYQSEKTLNVSEKQKIINTTPQDSKKLGRKVEVRDDWYKYKFEVMEKALRVKFSQNEWKQKLLDTNEEEIIEWNNWGDKIWGVTIHDCNGSNHLGKLLMKIRKDLKNGNNK